MTRVRIPIEALQEIFISTTVKWHIMLGIRSDLRMAVPMPGQLAGGFDNFGSPAVRQISASFDLMNKPAAESRVYVFSVAKGYAHTPNPDYSQKGYPQAACYGC